MATENLQIPDIASNQNQKEVTANAAHNLLDRAINNNVQKTVTVSEAFTITQTRENFIIELIGTPSAPVNLDMPDTNNRTLAIVNNTDDVMTIRNSASGGTGQPVISVGEASIFHYDGTNFFDLTALAVAAGNWISLTDTPSAYTGESGRFPQVNIGETAMEFVGTAAKRNVIAATTAALTLASEVENGDTIDGVVLVTGDRVLIKDQASGAENGIYIVEASGAPTRADDFDDDKDAVLGCTVAVNEGTANAQIFWQMTNITTVTIGSTAQTWAQTGGSASNRWTEATVQTTDATVTSIATIALASGDATVVRGFIIGTLAGSANSIAASFIAAGKNNGGTSAELAAASITTIDGDGGNSWAVTIDVDDTSDTIRIRVTGQTATTINWTVQYEIITET